MQRFINIVQQSMPRFVAGDLQHGEAELHEGHRLWNDGWRFRGRIGWRCHSAERVACLIGVAGADCDTASGPKSRIALRCEAAKTISETARHHRLPRIIDPAAPAVPTPLEAPVAVLPAVLLVVGTVGAESTRRC